MALVIIVMTGDITRQHARVRRMDFACNKGQAYTGYGLHAEAAQHRHMCMTTADQDQVLCHGYLNRLHLHIPVLSSSDRTGTETGEHVVSLSPVIVAPGIA